MSRIKRSNVLLLSAFVFVASVLIPSPAAMADGPYVADPSIAGQGCTTGDERASELFGARVTDASDADGDCVTKDPCLRTPPGQYLESPGCTFDQQRDFQYEPDGDYIPYWEDDCPFHGGSSQYRGCPADPDSDSDSDGLSDAQEVVLYGTQPNVADSDNDGFTDGDEVGAGTSPLDAASKPDRPAAPALKIKSFQVAKMSCGRAYSKISLSASPEYALQVRYGKGSWRRLGEKVADRTVSFKTPSLSRYRKSTHSRRVTVKLVALDDEDDVVSKSIVERRPSRRACRR